MPTALTGVGERRKMGGGEVRTMAAQQAGRGGWEQRLDEAGAWAEGEVRRVVAYLNEEVVPEVRRDGSRALRSAAQELRRLADRMEGWSGGRAAGGGEPPR